MLKTTVNLSVILFFVSVSIKIYSQDALSSAGADAKSDDGSVSYTVGQLVYTTNSELNGSVTQGVQQPFDIEIINNLPGVDDIVLEFIAFPNPVTDKLFLTTDIDKHNNLTFLLFDMTGKLIRNKEIVAVQTEIDMSSLAHGSYVLQVTDNQKVIKSYVVAKNH